MDVGYNLYAFSIPAILFTYWSLVGYATLSLLHFQRNTMQNLLLSPIVGCSVVLLFVFWLNRFGLPVKSFATILAVTLFIISAAILLWQKPTFPYKHYLPFGGIFILILSLIGSGLLKFGFNWISFANDDMTNYALGASRFLHHGFFDVPDIHQMLNKKDYSLLYWFWHVPGLLRSGSELLLAWVSGISKLNPIQIFMPTIVAFHLMLISTTGAMLYISRQKHSIALMGCLLLSFSSLTILGTLMQLIAQTLGLSLLIASLILVCHSHNKKAQFIIFKQVVLLTIIFSALLIAYPEVTPFFVLSVIIYFGLNFYKGWRPSRDLFHVILGVSILIVLFLNIHLLAVLEFFIREYSVASQSDVLQTMLFPYYLIPKGLANLWGFIPLSSGGHKVYVSLAIIAGGILLLISFFSSLIFTFRYNYIPAIVASVMLTLGLSFFIKNYGFGLFKLAMYIQPFLMAIVAILLFKLFKKNTLRNLACSIIILSGIGTVFFYLYRSSAVTLGTFTEIVFASSTKMHDEYKKLMASVPADAVVISDDFNISIIKLQALLSFNKRFITLTSPSNFMVGGFTNELFIFPKLHNELFYGETALEIGKNYLNNNFVTQHFDIHDKNHTVLEFISNPLSPYANALSNMYLVMDTGMRTIFNRMHFSNNDSRNFSLKKLNNVHNHLVFVDSDLGRIYHSVISNNTKSFSLFNLENDYFYPGKSMQSVGQYLLMRLINPSDKVRMVISMSNSFNGDGLNSLPKPSVIGNSIVNFHSMGSGSARLISEAFHPQFIEGVPYVATNMHTDGISFVSNRHGIENLYNKNISLDYRKVATFVRDISVLSEKDYLNLTVPTSISRFPQDLANNNLEYSGIYEDGWVSKNAFVRIRQSQKHNQLLVTGVMPQIDKSFTGTPLKILLDGKQVYSQNIKLGKFNINIHTQQAKTHKVEFHFEKIQHLPVGDNRPVGAQIKFIGFI